MYSYKSVRYAVEKKKGETTRRGKREKIAQRCRVIEKEKREEDKERETENYNVKGMPPIDRM